MRRLALGLAIAMLLGAAVSAVAEAGAVSKRDRGGTSTKALDIKSVTAVGGGFGLILKVRFKGNLERAIGRGNLRSAAVALILRPKPGAGRPSVVATTGRGRQARTLRQTRTARVEIVRLGKEMRFYVLGGGLSNVRRLQVKSFRHLRRGARTAETELGIDKALYNKILGDDGSDEITLPPPSHGDPCKSLRNEIEVLVQAGRGANAGELANALWDNRCAADLKLVSFGYEHVGEGDTRVCADLTVDPALLPALGWLRVFLVDPSGKPLSKIFNSRDFDVQGRLRAVWQISKGGKYLLAVYEVERGVGVTEVHQAIEVFPPPSPSTKDCTP